MATFNMRMPDGTVIRNIPEGTTRDAIAERYTQLTGKQVPASQDTQNASIAGAFMKGLKNSPQVLESLVKDVIPGNIDSLLGDTEGADKQFQDMKNRIQQQQNAEKTTDQPSVSSLGEVKDTYNKEGLGAAAHDLGLLLAEGVGSQATNLVTGMAGDYAGGAAAGTLAGPEAIPLGKLVGGMVGSIPFNLQDISNELAREGINPFQYKKFIAGATALMSGLDLPLLNNITSRFGGAAAKKAVSSAIVRMAKAGLKDFSTEGFTEALQQVVEDGTVSSITGKPISMDSIATAGLVGGFTGGVTGPVTEGIAELTHTPKINDESAKTEDILPTEVLPSEEVFAPPPIQSTEDNKKDNPQPNEAPVVEPTSANDIFKQATENKGEGLDTTPKQTQQEEVKISQPEPIQENPVSNPPETDLKQVSPNTMDETSNKPKTKFKPITLNEVVKDSFSNPNGYQFTTNAKNGRQAQYSKVANDLGKLTGLNVPVNVVFKNGAENEYTKQMQSNPFFKPAVEALNSITPKGKTSARVAIYKDENGHGNISLLLDDTGKSDSEMVRDIEHELGHGILRSLIQTDPNLSRAVLNDYNKKAKLANKKGLSPNEFNKMISSETFNKQGNPSGQGVSIQKGFNPIVKPNEQTADDQYFMSFEEYAAEGIARWMQTDAKPISIVDKYFKALGQILRNFAKYFKDNGYYPNDTINEVMNRLVEQAKSRAVANEMVQKGPELALQDLRAYHASPHYFEKFSTDKVDSGEGTQHEGWGLYFASLKDVAKWYYEMFQKGDRAKNRLNIKKQGKVITEINSRNLAYDVIEDIPGTEHLTKTEKLSLGSFLQKYYYHQINGENLDYTDPRIKEGQRIARALNLSAQVIKGLQPKLYSVDLNVDENKMVIWDEPMENQPEFIKKAFQGVSFKDGSTSITGYQPKVPFKLVYQRIVSMYEKEASNGSLFHLGGSVDAKKQASLLLNQLGLHGIKYLDGDSRATKEGHKTYNYVIFNDAAVEIRKIFDNDTEFMLSDKRKEPKTEKVEDTSKYKYVFKPEAISHEKGFELLSGEGDGKVKAFDKKGNVIGTLEYTKDKDKVNIESVETTQKGARQKQDTTYALIDAINRMKLSPSIEGVNSETKAYQNAYEKIQNIQKENVKAPTKDEAKITDVKSVPLFERNVLPSMTQKMQNFFKGLPKSIGLKVSTVNSILSRQYSVAKEMRFALENPTTFGLTKNDIKTLLDQKDNIVKFVSDNFRQGMDVPYLLSQRTEDIIPDAYDAYIEAKQADRYQFETTLTKDIEAVFDKLNKNVQSLKDELTRNGVTKLEDIYYVPTKFNTVDISKLADDSFNELENKNRITNFEKQQSYDDLVKSQLPTKGSIGYFSSVMKYLSPAVNVARNSPIVGRIFNLAMNRREYMLGLQNTFMGQLKPSIIHYEGKPEVFNAMARILESNRLNGFRGFIDKDGFYNYVDSEGKRRRLTDVQKSKELVNIRNLFDKLLDERVNITMSHRDTQEIFRNVGLSYNPKLQEINSILKNQGNKLSKGQISALESIQQYLSYVDTIKSRDYVPFTRKGSHGVTIKTKGEDGKKETIGFVTYDKDKNGNPIQDENWVKAQKLINEYAGKPDVEISKEFELTKDALLGQISNKEMTIDIIEQMIDLMSHNSNVNVLDTDRPNTMPAWKALGEIMTTDVMKKGFDTAMKESKNIKGYRDNWYSVIPTYLQGSSYALSNQRFAPLMRFALRASQAGEATKDEREYATKYAESLLKPESDSINFMRTLQFNYALGFNLSSAMIQLTSFTTLMPATLNLMTNNSLRSYRLLGKATLDAQKFFNFDLSKDKLHDLSPENIERIGKESKWTDDKINMLKRVAAKGPLVQTLSIEEIGANIHDKTTFKGRMGALKDKITRIAGLGLRTTEEVSRLSQFLAMYDALENPENLKRFHNIIYKDSEAYRQHLSNNPNLGADKEFLLKDGINLSLALFNKEGHAPFQNNLMQFVFPFATYPWQILINFYRMAGNMGPEGRKAAMLASAGMVFSAGLMGLPGFFLLKTLLEAVLSQVFDEDIDLDTEMLKLENHYQDENPWVYNLVQFLHRGAYSSWSGVDLNERTAFQTPFDTHVKAIADWLENGQAPSNFAQNTVGVLGGSIALAPVQALTKYRQTGGSLPETLNTLMPIAMRNLISSLVIEPEKGKSIMGTTVLTRDQARQPSKIIAGISGFKSRDEGLAEEDARAISQQEKRLDVSKTTHAKSLQRYYKDYLRDPKDPDSLPNYRKALSNYVQFLTDKGFSGDQISSSVQKLLKESTMDSISENDQQLNSAFQLQKAAKEAKDNILPFLKLKKD